MAQQSGAGAGRAEQGSGLKGAGGSWPVQPKIGAVAAEPVNKVSAVLQPGSKVEQLVPDQKVPFP